MKILLITLLKIVALAWVLWWTLHNAPLIVAPVFGAVALFVGIAGMVFLALTVGATVGLVVVIVFGAVACSLAAALSPIWLPLLAIIGLVALCRPKRTIRMSSPPWRSP